MAGIFLHAFPNVRTQFTARCWRKFDTPTFMVIIFYKHLIKVFSNYSALDWAARTFSHSGVPFRTRIRVVWSDTSALSNTTRMWSTCYPLYIRWIYIKSWIRLHHHYRSTCIPYTRLPVIQSNQNLSKPNTLPHARTQRTYSTPISNAHTQRTYETHIRNSHTQRTYENNMRKAHKQRITHLQNPTITKSCTVNNRMWKAKKRSESKIKLASFHDGGKMILSHVPLSSSVAILQYYRGIGYGSDQYDQYNEN